MNRGYPYDYGIPHVNTMRMAQDVVCLNMIRDIGLDDHDLPRFTRCASRAEGRLRAQEHLQSCPESVSRVG